MLCCVEVNAAEKLQEGGMLRLSTEHSKVCWASTNAVLDAMQTKLPANAFWQQTSNLKLLPHTCSTRERRTHNSKGLRV